MRRQELSTTVLVLAGLLCGCSDEVARPGTNPHLWGGSPAGSSVGGGAAASTPGETPRAVPQVASTSGDHIEGSMGQIINFTTNAPEVQTMANGAVVRIDGADVSAPWWVMTQLLFSSPLSDPAWAPGMVRTFVPGAEASDGLRVNVTSCSGPTRGRYTFDSAPQQVTVQIEQGATPDAKRVLFTQTWAATNQSVTGSFTFVPR